MVGRVLVGAVENEIEVDSNGAEFGTFNVVNVTECQSGKDVQYLIMDVVGGYKRTSDTLLKLKPGYWYGKSYKYAVVDGEPRDCVDVELRLNLPTQNHSMATSGVLVRAAVGKATEVLARSRCISAITESLELTPEQIRQRLKNTAE